ncbi:MAG TPA: S-adenosylmethionine:tRNA ribosyltransferase-isomerase [Propionibacteriaceae bacterium]|nr:S-adenosylmethionine:tRNA ribosyltransferase-isomerase [Propionibacteriaceae bacterium]
MSLLTEHPSTVFEAQPGVFALGPPEAHGLFRDDIRLLVAGSDGIVHTRFHSLADHLEPGDAVVVNRSATVAAAWDAHSVGHGPVVLHAGARLEAGGASAEAAGNRAEDWVIEVREVPDAARAVLDAEPAERFVTDILTTTLVEPYPGGRSSPTGHGNRLWRATVDGDLRCYLRRHGRPIAYGYLDRRYPIADYQTIFATVPGSAEMPSAGRPFSHALVTRLVARGIAVLPITLHTGLSSQEAGEAPQPEWFEVPASTARLVEATRAGGGRVVAVGTTVTRALESAVGVDGRMMPTSGWTERIVTPAQPARVVTGLVTGWHDPQASHLLLVEAVAGRRLAQRAYDEAVRTGYRWHEFGDSALLLPARS